MSRWRALTRGAHAERGAAAVEFAIVLVVLLLIIFAIIDFGRLLFAVQSMKSASREGARTAAVRAAWGPATSGTVLYAATNAGAAGAGLAGGTIQVTNSQFPGQLDSSTTPLCAPTAVNGSQVTGGPITVFATTDFRWFTPTGIFLSNVNSVSAETTMRCE